MTKRTDRSLAAVLLALALAIALAPAATAACQQTSLAEIDDEVMCPICGTPLGAAGGPQAEDEREFIRERVEQCESKEEIKAALVAEYGDEVLALPKRKGFNTAIYVVPAVAFALAAVAVAFAARRWRRTRPQTASPPAADAASAETADATLAADMDKYDL